MIRLPMILVCFFLVPLRVAAAGFWLPATDQQLRDDLVLLTDEGVMELPVTGWPIPRGDVQNAIARARLADIAEPGLRAALLRVRAVVSPKEDEAEWRLRETTVSAGEQGLLRHYGTLGRENLNLQVVGGASTDRWSVSIAPTLALSPADGQAFRLDGSDLTLRLGNWLFSANQMSRWWGPGQFGSLILSTNARPMPQLSVDRMSSERFSVPLLRWIGPWRFSAFVGAHERERPDIDNALFMGMRATFKPLPILEVGLSRTAQFCGQNSTRTRAPCNLQQVARVLVGQDNIGYRGVDGENEPGNQMAGIDLRLTSPFRSLPLAAYAQLIGEDSSNQSRSIIPNRYLGQFGLEGWWYMDSGAVVRGQLEYANTSCKWYSPAQNAECAYRQVVFFAGYRYRERNIGHTTDADSESAALRLQLVQSDGARWSARLTRAKLDRYGAPDVFNPLTRGRSRYESAELSWDGVLRGESLGLQVGYQNRSGSPSSESGIYGFLQWRRFL
jgi:hypothetical protein